MTKRENKLWNEAYKSSHVAAEICENVVHGIGLPSRERQQWLRAEAKNLLGTARELCRRRRKCNTNRPKGHK